MYKRIFYRVLSLLMILGGQASAQTGGQLAVFLHHYAGDSLLQLDVQKYKNALGQPYMITKFKYYLSDFRLKLIDGSEAACWGYFLVNQDDEASLKIVLNHLPEASFSGIRFTIGVDSEHNCSGAQEGALDPVNAMFWTWNSGYVFLKLEGKSPVANTPGHIFEYHIGGFRQPSNCIRTVYLPFREPLVVLGSRELHVKADVAGIFHQPADIDFAKLPSVTDAHNATTIADNYADIFSIIDTR